MQIDNRIMGRRLDEDNIIEASNRLGVTPAHVKAVVNVESSGIGFCKATDGEQPLPKILFEAHIFSRKTDGRFDTTHPKISSPRWNRELYAGGIKEHDRLRQAAELDFMAAHLATSWGLFQIMGFNHKTAGYASLYDFVGVQYLSEGLQLQCGVKFILANGLERFLKAGDWRGFAKGYNGPGYEANRYHEKLAAAFERYA